MQTRLVRAFALLSVGACSATAPSVRTAGHPVGDLSTQITGLSGRPFAVRVSSQGVVFTTQQDANSVATYTLATEARGAPILVGADPGDVVFTRDGNTAFVSAFYGGTVHVIDVARNRQTAVIPVSSNAYRLALSLDEATLFVSSTDGNLYAIDVATGRVSRSVALGGAIQGLALSSSGRTVIASSTVGVVWKLDAATLQIIATRIVGGSLQDIAISQDETEIYVANEGGRIDILDGGTLVVNSSIVLRGLTPFGLSLTPDNTQLYVTSPQTGSVAIIDRGTKALLKTLPVSGIPRRVAFDATGAVAVVANEGNWVDRIR